MSHSVTHWLPYHQGRFRVTRGRLEDENVSHVFLCLTECIIRKETQAILHVLWTESSMQNISKYLMLASPLCLSGGYVLNY